MDFDALAGAVLAKHPQHADHRFRRIREHALLCECGQVLEHDPSAKDPDPTWERRNGRTVYARQPGVWMMRWPARVESAANARDDWRVRATKTKQIREEVGLQWMVFEQRDRPRPAYPCRVEFLRIYSGHQRPFDADENLPMAFKAHKDEVAAQLGLRNDAGPEVRWSFQQERGPESQIQITIRSGT